MLIITLLTVSTVNATDIMANDTLNDLTVHNSYKETSQSVSDDEDIIDEEVISDTIEKTSNPEYGDVSDNINQQKTVKTVKTIKNENNILSENTPAVVKNVTNYTELLELFDGYNKPGIANESLIINLLGDEEYKITKTLDLRGGYSSYSDLKLKTLTINGNNKIIDGCGEYGFLELNDNALPLNLTLNNIIVKNCKSSQGAAIYVGDYTYSNVTINKSSFENNYAVWGGAIVFGGSSLKIIDSNFTSNSADYGATIYINSSDNNVNITNNNFKDNFVTSKSGWVINLNNATSIHNNLFVNNTDNNRDMLFNVLGKSVNNNTYIDNYLEDSWKDLTQPIVMLANQEKTLDLIKLRDVYNDTIVNGTIYCYLGGLDEPFAKFNVNDGSVKLKFDDSKLNVGLNIIRIRYVSLKHYQNLDGLLKINFISEPLTINVSKVWDDNNNPNRPTGVTIVLSNDFGEVGSIVLSSDNNWTYSFTNLPKYQNYNLINYTIDEPNVPKGYVKSISNIGYVFTVTNTNNLETVDYTVNIVWESKGSRPNVLKIQLYADGQVQGKPVNLKTNANQKYVFENLPKYNNGKLIKYAVKLVEVPKGYKESVTEHQYDVLIKLKKSGTKYALKWSWKLVKISYKHHNHIGGSKYFKRHNKVKLVKSLKTHNYVKHSKRYKYQWKKSYKRSNTVTYKYRLYIYLYSEYIKGTMSYNDFVAILKVNNIKVTKSNWKNGVLIVDYDDIDDVPELITLHDKKGRVPDSSSKVNKAKVKNSDNVIDSSEMGSSKSKNTKSKDAKESNNEKGVVDSDEVEVNTE